MKNEYESERNALIPTAEEIANSAAGTEPRDETHEQWCGRWNRAFHDAMNRLWRERSIRNVA